MKPFQTYFGGKEAAGTYQTIINHIRPHDLFVELFGGNYTISRRLNYPSLKLINDLDTDVYARYRQHLGFSFRNEDYNDILKEISNDFAAYRTVLYFDPPYLFESRKSKKRVYGCEFGTAAEHTEMLATAIAYGKDCDVLISHYPHPLYFDTLKGWYYTEFESQTRNGKATEGLWYNYEVDQLADYSYLGTDKTDRQRIKRRITLLQNKLAALPDLERKAVLSGIREMFAS